MASLRIVRWLERHRLLIAYFLLTLGVLLSLYFVNREAKTRSQANQVLIAELDHHRREQARGLQILIVNECREIEALKRKVRQQEIEAFKNLDRNLRLLGIKKTEKIVQAAATRFALAMDRYKAKPGGCGPYPEPIRPP